MSIKNTGVAARAGQEPAKSAEQVQREYRLQQKFNQISKADNASTTGLLVNPPAAVIPNTTQYYANNSGSGKEAGAQGMFGAQLGGGAGPNQNILYQTGDQGVTTVINGQKMNVPPNTTVYKAQQPTLYNSLNNAWNTFTGGEPATTGGLAGTRGALPTNTKVPGLASPARNPLASPAKMNVSPYPYSQYQGTAGMYNMSPSHVAYLASQSQNPSAYGLSQGQSAPYTGTAGMYNYSSSHVAYLAGQSSNPSAYGITQGQDVAPNPFYGAQAGGGSGSANFGGSIGTVRQGNTHVQNAPVGVYRDQFGNIGNGSTVVPIVYGHPGQPGTPGQQQTADPNFHPSVVKQGMTPSKPAPPANPNFSIGHANGPQYGGTAGMYTYGQFTNREDAFTALIGKVAQYEQATGTASGMTIPATIADNLGLTASLQDPSSGWKFQNGVWVNTNKPNTPAGNDYSKLGSTDFTSTQFYQDYAAKNVPFEQQMRYDPATGKYISVGAYMLKKKDKNAYLTRGDRQTKLAQRQKQARKVGYGEQQTSSSADSSSYYQPVDQQPTPFTGSWGVVNFNTGTG